MSGRILIVDSVSTNRIVLRVKMLAAKYDVDAVASCADARSRIADCQPDLILINLTDESEDGHGFCRSLREDAVNLANATHKLTIPVAAYGGDTFLGDIRAQWQTVAEQVEGGVVAQCGHFIPEEQPAFVIEHARSFFAGLVG